MLPLSTTALVNRSLNIYLGIPLFISGMIGNSFNLCLLWPTRHNPCAFLLSVSSIFNCLVLICGLFTRILITGFDIDWTQTNIVWCKMRLALNLTGWLISLSCTCLASIDRYLVSCRKKKYRKLSRLSTAIWAVIVCILFWMGHAVPYIIIFQVLPSVSNNDTTIRICTSKQNIYFGFYRVYFVLPVLFALLPCVLLIFIGGLTYRNISCLTSVRHRQIAQRQLTSMLLFQIPFIVVPSIQYIGHAVYANITSTIVKSSERIAIEDLHLSIATLLFYVPYAWPFFIFCLSSTAFRRDAKQLIMCRNRQYIKRNSDIQSIPLFLITHLNKG